MGRQGCAIGLEVRRRIVRLHDTWGWSNAEIAAALGVDPGTVRRWVGRWERGEGLESRPYSTPARAPGRTSEALEARICAMRRTGARRGEIAGQVGLCPETVTRILVRCGLGLVLEPDGFPPARE